MLVACVRAGCAPATSSGPLLPSSAWLLPSAWLPAGPPPLACACCLGCCLACCSAARTFSTVCTSVLLGTAPMIVSIFLPPLKIMTVGMERMPYSVATPGDSSVLSLT